MATADAPDSQRRTPTAQLSGDYRLNTPGGIPVFYAPRDSCGSSPRPRRGSLIGERVEHLVADISLTY